MTSKTRKIYCAGCERDVAACLTDGAEIYPHRRDLRDLPFWKCRTCGNFVGCHHKTQERTRPLGCIPTPEIKEVRQRIHRTIDPIWKSKRLTRAQVYARMSELLGWKYHTAELRSINDARAAHRAAKNLEASV